MGSRKRNRDDDVVEGSNMMNVADTLSRVNGAAQDSTVTNNAASDRPDDDDSGGEWQVAESKRARKRKKTTKNESGNNYPSISHSSHARLQTFVKIGDLQNLILYVLADGTAPQWCAVGHHTNFRKVVALMVPGLEAGMFDGSVPLVDPEGQPGDDRFSAANSAGLEMDKVEEESKPTITNGKSKAHPDDYYPFKLEKVKLPEALRPLGDVFEHVWPIKSPGDDKYAKMHSPLAAMLTAPIVKTKEMKKARGPQPPSEIKNWKNNRTPVAELLATTEELVEESYTIHPAHFEGSNSVELEAARRIATKTTAADGWVDTPDISNLAAGNVPEADIEQGSITAGRNVFAMDCEMCITSPTGQTPQVFSLTRISLIDWDGKVVMDEYVRPAEPITDYLTPYSGITAKTLENVTTTLQDIQKKLLNVLTPRTILVGHSLNSDFNALKLTHPFIIDTTLLFPHPRGPPLKSSLKWLAQKYLSREIQKGHGSTGHDSIEDALACLDLVKQKCEKGRAWATPDASGESIFKRLSRAIRPKRDKVTPNGDEESRLGAVVDWGEPSRGYGAQAKVAIGCEKDAEVVAGIKHAVMGDDDKTVPHGGCDFVWARLRELEAHRGWWNRSKRVDSEDLRSSTAANVAESSLEAVVRQTVERICEVYAVLPPCTALVVYSGSADPRELTEMQALKQKFKEEYRVKKWDQLSVQWTDVEEQRLRAACEKARKGIGFIAVK